MPLAKQQAAGAMEREENVDRLRPKPCADCATLYAIDVGPEAEADKAHILCVQAQCVSSRPQSYIAACAEHCSVCMG